ncbi:hypothetical protein Afil01_28530 [Actinorhabdospora filicis]|uniref:DUF397 domain-containing protein n=1 Tax=Actinorhabdospora filicis TaxID=1785913 RepID=A0A9W6SLL8_9ACTN|nr:DUF397 domain-containing protein [Actinorhabdospora filicis]GLZ78046.1 hypothetical protein Afil01_28530 [Actinorhabdospora filicis]
MVSTSPWKKSSRSQNQGQCVEARITGGRVQARDSKQLDGPVLTVSSADWAVFLAVITR